MEVLDVVVVLDEAHVLREFHPHIACCVADQFLCGTRFHPEAMATEEDDEDACCTPCVDLRYEALCRPDRPTHSHCPLDPERICP